MATNNGNNTASFENDPNFDERRNLWWWSPEAYIIKFAVLSGLFIIFVAYFLGGYLHAQRRIRKGLAPLAYHRWLLSRAERAQFDPSYQDRQYTVYQVQDGYAMSGYPPPPPAYNPSAPPPPTYQPPQGGSKIIPSQTVYPAPPGPPPSSSNAELPPREDGQANGGFLSRFKRK